MTSTIISGRLGLGWIDSRSSRLPRIRSLRDRARGMCPEHMPPPVGEPLGSNGAATSSTAFAFPGQLEDWQQHVRAAAWSRPWCGFNARRTIDPEWDGSRWCGRRSDQRRQQDSHHRHYDEQFAGHSGTSFLSRSQESRGGIGPSGQMAGQLARYPLSSSPLHETTNKLPLPDHRLPIADCQLPETANSSLALTRSTRQKEDPAARQPGHRREPDLETLSCITPIQWNESAWADGSRVTWCF